MKLIQRAETNVLSYWICLTEIKDVTAKHWNESNKFSKINQFIFPILSSYPLSFCFLTIISQYSPKIMVSAISTHCQAIFHIYWTLLMHHGSLNCVSRTSSFFEMNRGVTVFPVELVLHMRLQYWLREILPIRSTSLLPRKPNARTC